jgi:hypothetical protein
MIRPFVMPSCDAGSGQQQGFCSMPAKPKTNPNISDVQQLPRPSRTDLQESRDVV